jgi:TRAP-type transport system large permease protein
VPFGWIVATSQAPMKLAQFLTSISDSKYVILAIINIGLLIVGCFMETTAILLIVTPTLLPIIVAVGIDPVHFGIIMCLNLIIGAVTPPFGVILFIMKDIAKVSFGRLCHAILPFYIPLGLTLLVITYWPAFVLFVPRLFKG